MELLGYIAAVPLAAEKAGDEGISVRLREARGHDRELVSAQPDHQVLSAHRVDQASCRLPQDLVAHRMAVVVVDQLEVVEVEQRHRDRPVDLIGKDGGQAERSALAPRLNAMTLRR